MKTPTSKQQIIDILKEKSCLKQSIFSKTIDVFDKFKSEAEILVKELSLVIAKHDKKVVVEYQLKGDYEFHIKFGGDIGSGAIFRITFSMVRSPDPIAARKPSNVLCPKSCAVSARSLSVFL